MLKAKAAHAGNVANVVTLGDLDDDFAHVSDGAVVTKPVMANAETQTKMSAVRRASLLESDGRLRFADSSDVPTLDSDEEDEKEEKRPKQQ